MPKHLTPPEELIQQLQHWEPDDLTTLQDMLQALIAVKCPEEIPAKLDGSAIGPRGGAGCIELKHITDRKSGKTFGPYRYLRYRGVSQKTGKPALLSVYLGKVNAIGS
jgi:hypothetical protein